ncbi:HEAT repeat domain-containing protein [Paenibacillus bovis]|uniref:HEAT repeat domain-containing protein n=1 Tax=Paenibacillus bovis TaxID=1616788 RepID=A0A172ZI45_9BACL|nr:HEAT repeat domain-containing protein [Paenibacillus bovis]ANF97072.1 hypothetical protein AR543_14380 [Paenibacillus bovis]
MASESMRYTSYTRRHMDIIQSGVESIREFLEKESQQEKQNLVFCMDRFLDPWFGYDLPYTDQIILLLQQHLFIEESSDIQMDILDLLCQYGQHNLDILAQHIGKLEPDLQAAPADPSKLELLANALYALGLTYNRKYIPVVAAYESYDNPVIQKAAIEALHELHQAKS